MKIHCKKCKSSDVKHEERAGRGLPPESYKPKSPFRKLISWYGVWDYWTCNACGDVTKKLRK